jgi:hypothetical protein
MHVAIANRRQCLLKKKASEKLYGRALATEPGASQNSVAKTAFTNK